MSTTPHINTNGIAGVDINAGEVRIEIDYDEASETVSVTPGSVRKGTTVRFVNPKGKLRIVFLSPTGKATDEVSDSETCTLTVGGTYHFKCFFFPQGASSEISPANGGVIDVIPQRP